MKTFWTFGIVALAVLSGCGEKTDGTDTGTPDLSTVDMDGDGSMADVDCDDSDATSFPGAEELCDGLDNDCDSEVDEEQFEMFADTDSDGFGAAETSVFDCELREGHVTNGDDCDDSDAAVNPDATEICDGINNDCDTATSEVGTVMRTDANGNVSDVSAWFLGSPASPAEVLLEDDGDQFMFCEGTYFTHIEVKATDVELAGRVGEAENTILDGADLETVVQVIGEGLELSLSDLTIQRGAASVSTIFEGVMLGGGVLCVGFESASGGDPAGPAYVNVMGVILKDNTAEYGGGLLSVTCEVTVEESLVTGNYAEDGAGLYVVEGNAYLTDVVIEEHVDIPGISGFLLESWGNSWNAFWEDVQIRDNSSAGTGIAASVAGGLYWESVGSTRSGLWGNRNLSNGESAALYVQEVLQVTDVDFGEPGTVNENDGTDFFHGASTSHHAAGDQSTFSCTDDEAGCGSPQTYAYGSWDQSNTSSEGFFGHVVSVQERGTLREFELGVANSNCATHRSFLMRRSAVSNGANQSWEVVWTGYSSSIASTWMHSGRVGQVLEPGYFYALAFGFDCGTSSSGVNMSRAGTTGVDLGFATSVGAVSKLGTYSSIGTGSTLTMMFAAEDEFNMVVEMVEL